MSELRVAGLFNWNITNSSGLILDSGSFVNGVTTQGLNAILDAYFRASTGPSFFASLISATAYTGVASADTMASHAGWAEYTSYTSSTRPALTFPAAAGGISQCAAFSFAASSIATVEGLLICTNSTKGGTTGTLWSTGVFDTPRKVLPGQNLNLSYYRVILSGS